MQESIRIDSDKFNFNFILSALRYRSIVRVHIYRSSCQAGFISKVLLSFYDKISNKNKKMRLQFLSFIAPRVSSSILKETIGIHRFSTIVNTIFRCKSLSTGNFLRRPSFESVFFLRTDLNKTKGIYEALKTSREKLSFMYYKLLTIFIFSVLSR